MIEGRDTRTTTPASPDPERTQPDGGRSDGTPVAVLSGVLSFDARLAVTFADQRLLRLLGLPAGALDAPRSLSDLLAEAPALGREASRRFQTACAAAVNDDAPFLRVAVGRPARDHLVQVTRTGSGTWTAVVGSLADAEPASGAVTADTLTGLADRSLFGRRLATALLETGADRPGPAVLFVDLDRFKPVNDTLGHPTGDALLRLVGKRLRAVVRERDLVARLGGDEFAVLVPEGAGEVDLAALAGRVVDVLGRPYLVDGHQVNIGASVGVARAPGDGADGEHLLRSADLALYHAKNAGRNTFSVFDASMQVRALARRNLEVDLRKGLALREFELFYQPQIDLECDAIVGFEALMRWRHPVRGLVSPAEFIPLAEEIGFIVPLGEWALREACREAMRWPDHISVAVNVSPRQFENCSKLLDTVRKTLEASGLPGHRLEVEITESVLLRNEDAVLQALYALRALGVRIAMDDFGTGYSSLSQLNSFPFDKIKIDRSFVTDRGRAAGQTAIVRAITALGASLGMATIAEGVETAEQLARIRAEGCGSVQGYLFSRPVPAAELDSVIARFAPHPATLSA